MTTPITTGFQPGDIRSATIRIHTADGGGISDIRQVLLLDVRPGAEPDTYRVLWQTMTGVGRDWLPGGMEPRWTTINAFGRDITPGRRAVTVDLDGEYVGQYRPRDPQYNSVEVLRDAAIARVEQMRAWDEQHRPADVAEATAAYRAAEREVEAAREHWYERIRDALARGVSAYDLRDTTGLTVARIYQIRDGRR